MLFAVVLVVVILWLLRLDDYVWGVPRSYQECVRNPRSTYNQVSCSIFYNSSLVGECISFGGCNPAVVDGPSGCNIGFFNPNFEYPDSYETCMKLKSGRRGTSERTISGDYASGCWVFLNGTCKGDQISVDNIMNMCPSDYDYEEKDYGHTFVRICEKGFR